MSYNLTGIGSNTTGLLTFIQGVNSELMFGWLGVLLLIGLSVVIFMAFMVTTGDAKKAMAATGFLSFVMALFLRMMSLIPDSAIFITLLLAAIAIGFSFMGDND